MRVQIYKKCPSLVPTTPGPPRAPLYSLSLGFLLVLPRHRLVHGLHLGHGSEVAEAIAEARHSARVGHDGRLDPLEKRVVAGPDVHHVLSLGAAHGHDLLAVAEDLCVLYTWRTALWSVASRVDARWVSGGRGHRRLVHSCAMRAQVLGFICIFTGGRGFGRTLASGNHSGCLSSCAMHTVAACGCGV